MKSLSQTQIMSNSYIFATQCWRHYICQAMNSVKSNDLISKYQRFSPKGCKHIGILSFEFVVSL